jgi:hypothetical protein
LTVKHGLRLGKPLDGIDGRTTLTGGYSTGGAEMDAA